MLAGLSSFLFGSSANECSENDACTDLIETDIRETDGDEWVLINIGFEDKKFDSASDERSGTQHLTLTNVPRDENRCTTVPDETTKNTPTAKQKPLTPQSNNSNSNNNNNNNNCNGTMEGSWFITPPPCFTHPNTFTMESSPLEDILIEHPSISVFSPRPPPKEMKSNAKNKNNFATEVKATTPDRSLKHKSSSTNRTSKAAKASKQKPQQERENVHQQRSALCDLSAKAGLFAEITNTWAPMQKAKEIGSQMHLKKSFMNRQNKVAHHLNSCPSRRHKLAMKINGYSINRKMC